MAGEYDVLIVDDDPLQASLLQETLEELGYTTSVLPDGSRVVEEAKRAQPRLVIMDIIMPGADGLSLCMKLKPVLRAWDARVVITSGKDRVKEEPRALKAGAAAFLQKPFKVADLRAHLDKLLGAPGTQASKPHFDFAVKVWGSRGPGQPPPGASGSSYGVHTPCISIGSNAGDVVILDAGSGIKGCSEALLALPHVTTATLLLTHYHPAHIEGLKGLGLLAKPEFTLRVMGPRDPDTDVAELCRSLGAKAKLEPYVIEESDYRLSNDLRLRVAYMNHPSTTFGFALQLAGRKIVYIPDADLPAEGEVEVGNNVERVRQFAEGADLLIFDTHFAPEDLAAQRGEGHSSWPAAVRLARAAGARRLWLFHTSRSYSDAKVAELEAAAKRALTQASTSIACEVAKDGLTLQL